MTPKQFPHLGPGQLERLADRGIDPERSYQRFIAAVLDGTCQLWRGCKACGVHRDYLTPGCLTCYDRHKHRRARSQPS